MSTIGSRIRSRRIELGLTQEEVAKALGKNQNTIVYYESNKAKTLKKDVVDGLCRILKCDKDWLMGEHEATLQQYPQEIRSWLSKPEAVDYVLDAFSKYLRDKTKID